MRKMFTISKSVGSLEARSAKLWTPHVSVQNFEALTQNESYMAGFILGEQPPILIFLRRSFETRLKACAVSRRLTKFPSDD